MTCAGIPLRVAKPLSLSGDSLDHSFSGVGVADRSCVGGVDTRLIDHEGSVDGQNG